MKKIFIFLIQIYQAIISPFCRTVLGMKDICRFSPTCSEQMKQQIEKKGIIRGGYSGMQQLMRCHPFAK